MTKKIAVSLPDKALAHAKSAVLRGHAESVSGYIASLIEREAEEESVAEMLARWNREDGRAPADVARGEAAVRADFERMGLVPKGGLREGSRRRSA